MSNERFELSFAEALEAVKQGKCASYEEWLDKKKIVLVPQNNWEVGNRIPYDEDNINARKLAFVALITNNYSLVPYYPNPQEMLSDNGWRIVD